MQIFGEIFDIQRFSVHDGPGIRTNVFFKGCSLNCEWCCNPESQLPYPQPFYEKHLCLNCHMCVNACPKNAIQIQDNIYSIESSLCKSCRNAVCQDNCNTRALHITGSTVQVEDVLKVVARDMVFYQVSGGGVTATGGECMLQPEFLRALLIAAKELAINTAIETSLAVPRENVVMTLGVADTYLCDVKHVNAEKLYEFTGADNAQIIGNFSFLCEQQQNVIARIPVIPGFNDTKIEINEIGKQIKKSGGRKVELLPYHSLGNQKYEKIFSRRKPLERHTVDAAHIRDLQDILSDLGLEVENG